MVETTAGAVVRSRVPHGMCPTCYGTKHVLTPQSRVMKCPLCSPEVEVIKESAPVIIEDKPVETEEKPIKHIIHKRKYVRKSINAAQAKNK